MWIERCDMDRAFRKVLIATDEAAAAALWWRVVMWGALIGNGKPVDVGWGVAAEGTLRTLRSWRQVAGQSCHGPGVGLAASVDAQASHAVQECVVDREEAQLAAGSQDEGEC